MQVVIAPTRFWLPSSTSAGPNRICLKGPVVPTRMRVPRGRLACGVAIPQWYPFPGASIALAKALPIITASQGLTNVASFTHAAVVNNRHVPAAPLQVVISGGCAIHSGGDLRDA